VYGGGDPGIVDIPYFINNFKTIIIHTYQLWIPLLILAVILFIQYRKNRGLTHRISLAVLLIKQYKIKSIPILFLLPILAVASFNLIKIPGQLEGLRERKIMHQEALNTFQPYLGTDKPKLIVASYYGCSAVEYSLHFGLHESGKYGKELTAEYKKHYPNTILYFPWGDAFFDGVYQPDPKDILKPGEYVLFVADHSDQMMDRFIKMLSDTTDLNSEYTLLKEFKPKAEAVYKLQLKR
jgi:hypothetical protein